MTRFGLVFFSLVALAVSPKAHAFHVTCSVKDEPGTELQIYDTDEEVEWVLWNDKGLRAGEKILDDLKFSREKGEKLRLLHLKLPRKTCMQIPASPTNVMCYLRWADKPQARATLETVGPGRDSRNWEERFCDADLLVADPAVAGDAPRGKDMRFTLYLSRCPKKAEKEKVPSVALERKVTCEYRS